MTATEESIQSGDVGSEQIIVAESAAPNHGGDQNPENLSPMSTELKNILIHKAKPIIDNMAEVREVKLGLASIWRDIYEQKRQITVKEESDIKGNDERGIGSEVSGIAVDDETESVVGGIATGSALNPGVPTTEITDLQQEKIDAINRNAESSRTRPNWDELIDKNDGDDDERRKKRKELIDSLPDDVQDLVEEHLEELEKLTIDQATISSDPEALKAYSQLAPELHRVQYQAGQYGYYLRRAETLRAKASNLRLTAHTRQRPLNDVEARVLERYLSEAARLEARAASLVTDGSIKKEILRRTNIARAEQLKSGFLETERMKRIIDVVFPRLAAGLPAGFFGEIGGAKSGLAVYIAREYFGVEPVRVDCGPDVTMAKFFGGTKLRANEQGGTDTYEEPGDLTRAAEEGRPIILDEFDTLPGRVRTALNGALQWRPGQTVRPFGMNRDITIKPGFCMILTANLRSSRYDREKLDISTLDRIQNGGAGIFEIGYPDSDLVPGESSAAENLTLAIAQLTNQYGELVLPSGLADGDPRSDPASKLIVFVNAVHIIQRFFSESSVTKEDEIYIPDSAHLIRSRSQGKPILEEAVISPRGMIGILRNLQISGENTTLARELANWVSMQRNEMDRMIVSTVLATRGLLAGVTEKELNIPQGTLKKFMSGSVS